MARTKNYTANPTRLEQFQPATEIADTGQLAFNSGDARIDMAALVGPTARFAANDRNIDLNDWLNCSIDAWVWSVLDCLQSFLLSGARETATVTQYAKSIRHFFAFLTEGQKAPRVAKPADLSPLHIDAFLGWLQMRGQQLGRKSGTMRTVFNNVKAVLLEMFAQGHIPGESTRFFKRRILPGRSDEVGQSSLSDAEQERLARAIKTDLVDIHHGRLQLSPGEVQALRLLLVAHRQGTNPAPLLELQRNAMAPGPLPGTICMSTAKFRSRKVRSSVGRAMPDRMQSGLESEEGAEAEVVFGLAEGAVLQQAITSTEALVKEAPARYKSRVWLYRSQATNASKVTSVTCLTTRTLGRAISALIARHELVGDNGDVLRLNLSRLRKSYFDRALRNTDGDLLKTANLMGNTPRVAGSSYSLMNESRKAEAAEFMNEEYTDLMRGGSGLAGTGRASPQVIDIKLITTAADGTPTVSLERTPVSGCKDTLNGEHAPRDGRNHCDRYVMCLFCSSFAIVGSADELWRLFSFQAFAKAELRYLDMTLGSERTNDEAVEDLRDRYRIAIPFIDQFTERQFAARVINEARAKTEAGLHPFWLHQMVTSRRARKHLSESELDDIFPLDNGSRGDTHDR